MYEAEIQYILRCGLCNKPFDRESTLKRHGYYCRSRKVGGTTRTRSCIACAKGKARCDNKRPECSRCITKAIECHYLPKSTKRSDPKSQESDDATSQRWNTDHMLAAYPPAVENQQENTINGDLTLDSALVATTPDCGNIGFLDWNATELDFSEFLDPPTNIKDFMFQYPSSRSSSLVPHSTPSTEQSLQAHQVEISPDITIPPTPTIKSVRAMVRKTKLNSGIANLILHTLKSYPLMMLRHNTLPPFIHPHLVSSDAESKNMEPLTNCISLVHMISSGYQGSRKLFWKNVQLECEYLCAEHMNLDRWQLLAAMQALSIYLLIRLDEGETDKNNIDYLLLAAVTVIAKRLASINVTYSTRPALSKYGLETDWKEWVYEESRHRLAVVYRVVNMLVHFQPASLCTLQTDLILAPLPAKKQLWEASDQYVFKTECERDPGIQTAYGLAANGQLVELDEGQLYCGDVVLRYKSLDARNPWEEWCAGMDGFGGLIMLAASLVV